MPVGKARPLLRAKLLVPRASSTVVDRSRLHDRLRPDPHVRLSTVIAPAGWGKTTMLAAWARGGQWQGRVGWLSLDEADDEPVRFWTYALAALDTVAPHLTRESLAALSAPGMDPLGVALPALLNALSGCDDSYALILDDFHVVRDPLIHQSVEFVLTYLPPALRLVIASRMDPPLPLARMRARGELQEIRVADLRCTTTEGVELLARVSNAAKESEGAGKQLVDHTEGWPAGLHLAALVLRERGDADAMTVDLVDNDRHLLDYFAAEVLPALSGEQHEFLVKSSVLERLSGPLCDAALGTSNAGELLDELDRAGLFISSLGRGWYRCHRLFREVLNRELLARTADGPRGVLGRAADWFLSEGRLEEAIEHHLTAGNHAEALQLMVGHDRWFLDRGAFAAFLRLGEMVAESISDARLFVSLAVAAGESGKEDRCVHWLRRAAPLIVANTEPLPGWRTLQGQADMTWAMFASPGDQDAALRFARRAIELEDDPTLPGYVVSRQVYASALWGAGRIDEAIALLQECWQSPTRRELPSLLTLQAAGQFSGLLLEAGDLDGARRITHEVQEMAEAAERAWGQGAAAAIAALRFVEARLTMESDPEASVPLFVRAVDLAEGWGWATMTVRALAGLAAAQWAAGDKHGARTALARAHEVADTGEARPWVVQQLEALETRIGVSAATTARARGALAEELTDRELSMLRALRGPLSAREIGAEMYLSINTVKGYTKSLYRKLGVVTRADAVRRGHEIGLI